MAVPSANNVRMGRGSARDGSRPHCSYFDRWTLINPAEMHERRVRWPLWRRALRPVGATVWFVGILLGIFIPGFNDWRHAGWPVRATATVMISCVLLCVALGVGLEWRDRHREGQTVFGRAKTGTPNQNA